MSQAFAKRRSVRASALATVVLAVVVFATGLFGVFAPAALAASSSSLVVLDGTVTVSRDGSRFAEGHDGELLQQGDVVRTGDGAHAILTFYDGSTIEVEPNTQIVVETIQATARGDIFMILRQDFGRTWHVVTHALTPVSKYEVRTPTSIASVRGTAFLVAVESSGRSSVHTTDGVVATSGSGQEIRVPPGFETTVEPGAAPVPATRSAAPASIVRVVFDATPTAVVVDPNGRTVGVVNGAPLRYIPGSTVQLVDGKLVITIPDPTPGRLTTQIQPAHAGEMTVDARFEVERGGAVTTTTEHRAIGTTGVAKGGVVLTGAGASPLPDDEAGKVADPRIGHVPPPPGSGLLPFLPSTTPRPTPIITPAPDGPARFALDPLVTAAPAGRSAQPSTTTTPPSASTSATPVAAPPLALPTSTPKAASPSAGSAIATAPARLETAAPISPLPSVTALPAPAPSIDSSATPRPPVISTPLPSPVDTPQAPPSSAVTPTPAPPTTAPTETPIANATAPTQSSTVNTASTAPSQTPIATTTTTTQAPIASPTAQPTPNPTPQLTPVPTRNATPLPTPSAP